MTGPRSSGFIVVFLAGDFYQMTDWYLACKLTAGNTGKDEPEILYLTIPGLIERIPAINSTWFE
jgi:hypothetical protein